MGDLPFVTAGERNEGISDFVSNALAVFSKNTITIDMFGSAKYRNYNYGADDHISVVHTEKIPTCAAVFVCSAIHKVSYTGKFDYGRNFYPKDADELEIYLPLKNGNIDFDFMASFIAELEAQRIEKLEAYFRATGLATYYLTEKEKEALRNLDNLDWQVFNLEKLFGKSTRGKRLKSDDRIAGALPFVTAGEADEGVSAFISNDVDIFSANTTTIDMFGSAKYRNYEYGADDHIAVVHTQDLPKFASIFITTAIHKNSYAGQFSYSRNFYSKDADELNILLPAKNQQPDYHHMAVLISAIQKLVIKDVVRYLDQKTATSKGA